MEEDDGAEYDENQHDDQSSDSSSADGDHDPNDSLDHGEIEPQEDGDHSLEIDQFIETKVEESEPGSTNKKGTPRKKYHAISKCEICNKIFSRRSTCRNHIKLKHENIELNFPCPKCAKKFANAKRLAVHERVHWPEAEKMVHPCPYCDKKFSRAVSVQAHVRSVHRGERPFICEECGKSFGTKGALKEHQITHSDERPYQCSYCPKKFKNLPRLKTHEDIHNDTMYVCIHCGLQLNTKRTLKMHMVVHSDTKKYKCHYCGNEYKRSKALKNHLILHTGLRPYACPFCDKTFANGSNCRSHKKKAHPAELAAAEAAGETTRVTNMPKLEHLQPKSQTLQQMQQQAMAAGINPALISIGPTLVDNMQLATDVHSATHQTQPHSTQLGNIVHVPSVVDLTPLPVPLLSSSTI